MSEWRYLVCDRCGAESRRSMYPALLYRLDGWTYKNDPDPAVMGSDYCPRCTAALDGDSDE